MAKKLNRNLVGVLTLVGMVLLAGAGFALLANLPGRDPKVYEDEAKKHEEKGEYDVAAANYQRAFFRDPENNPEYLIKAAKCLLEDGKVGAAREWIQQARQRDPQLKSATELKADLEYEVAKIFPSNLQWNSVLDEAKKLAAVDKGSSRAMHMLGHAYLALQGEDEGYREKGQEALQKAVELDPSNADAVELLVKDQWQSAAIDKAKGDKARGEAVEKSANSLLAIAIEKCPPTETKKTSQLRRLQALYELAQGRIEAGMSRLTELLSQEKTEADTHLAVGQLYIGGLVEGVPADPAKAEATFMEAIRIDPKEGAAYEGLGQVYGAQREAERDPAKREALIDKVVDVYRKALDSIPRTKHFRSMKDNLYRVHFIRELFLAELDRAATFVNDAKKKDAALAAAESWITVLKDEIDAGSKEVRFMTASLYNARGDSIAATKEAEAARRLPGADKDIRLQLLLAELYWNQQQWGLCRDAILKAIAIRPGAPTLRLRLAQLYLKLSDPAMAMMELKPREPGPLHDFMMKSEAAAELRVEAYRQLNQPQLAQEESERLSKGQGGAAAELRRAILLMSEGKHADAEIIIKQVREKQPNNEVAARSLFRIYEVMDRREDARKLVDAMLAQDAANNLYRQMKLSLLVADKAPEAEILAFLAQEKDPFRRALNNADYLASLDKLPEAIKQLDEAEKLKPDDSQVIDRQLRLAIASKDMDRAERYVQRDAALNHDGTEGLLSRGRLAFAKKDYPTAVTLLRSGVEKYPSNAMGWTYLGETYLAMNQLADAKAMLSKAVEIDPTNGFANRGLADLALRDNDEKTARRYLESAARSLPEDRWTTRQMQMLSEKQNPDKGILTREKLRKENPKDLDNLVLLARLYAQEDVKKFDKAEEVYIAALELSKKDLTLAREIAMFYGRDDVNQPAKGHELLVGMLRDEQDNTKKALIAISIGMFYERQKSLATADRYFRTAVSLDPSAQVLGSVSEFYARTNRYKESVEYYRMLLDKIKDDSKQADLIKQTRARIIALWLAMGDLDNAKREIDTYMASYPGDETGMIYEGAFQRIGGDIQKAKEAFDAHLEKNPENAVALWQRGQMYMLMGRWQLAVDDLRRAKTFNPDGFLYQHRISLATALIELARYEEAIVELRAILDKDPAQLTVAEALVDAYMRARPPRFNEAEGVIYAYMRQYPKDYRWPMLLGRLGEKSKKLDKAIEGYEKASDLAREVPEVTASLIRAYQEANQPSSIIDFVAAKVSSQQLATMPLQLAALGWAYHQTKQDDQAMKMYNQAMSAASQNFLQYLRVIAEMTQVLGREEVLSRAKAEVAAEPENIEKQKMLVHLLQLNGNTQESLDECRKIEKMAVRDQDMVFALIGQGMLLERLEKPEDARAKYEAALKLDPKNAVCLNNLAFLLAERLNQPKEALPYAREAASVDKRSADVLDTYGWILALNKQRGEAMGALMRALDIDRENVAALYHLGLLHTEAKEYEDARARLLKAKEVVETQPDKRFLPKITKALEDLDKLSH